MLKKVLFLLLALLSAGTSSAQILLDSTQTHPGQNSFRGRCVDVFNQPIDSVSIVYYNHTMFSDKDGGFTLYPVNTGDIIRLSHPLYKDAIFVVGYDFDGKEVPIKMKKSILNYVKDQRFSWIVSGLLFLFFLAFQLYYFFQTKKRRELFANFFERKSQYEDYRVATSRNANGESFFQLVRVGKKESDLNNLIDEINKYISKSKGTTDFSIIQNKVERKLKSLYDLSMAKLSFPTYFGLMGTFAGVFIGILMFIFGFDSADNISDLSIKNLLIGVLVSMSTSLVGLILTTISNAKAGETKKKVDEDKNHFYDFLQSELMPSLDVSMVTAVTKLHETVDRFEPAFDRVIQQFQTAFDSCTRAFGESFEQNVNAVADAIAVMGANMDKVNRNIQLQEKLLSAMQGDKLIKGMDKYIEASNHFVNITESLNKFEEARRMMLAAAQEAINLQDAYADSLKIPQEVAERINDILNRIKLFEQNINRIGGQLNRREILGNDVVDAIEEQIKGISKKEEVADKYLELADDKLEELFQQQTSTISEMNNRYRAALEGHVENFEKMLTAQTEELEKRHKEFMKAIEQRLAIEDIRKEFSSLGKLKDIDMKMSEISRELDEIRQNTGKSKKGLFKRIFRRKH